MKNRLEVLREYIDRVILDMTDFEERRCAYVHLYGVSQVCAMIALKRGENAELACMAGMLHDLYSYKFLDTKNHAEKGAVLARELLNEVKITTEEETNIICSAIHNHSAKGEHHSAFDEVLIDADVLQHCVYDITAPVKEHERSRFEILMKEFGFDG